MSKSFSLFLAGVVVGILIAPEKGSETRRKISKYVSNTKNKWNSLKQDSDSFSSEEREDILVAVIQPAPENSTI